MDNKTGRAAALIRKVSDELWRYAAISAYMYVCLGALILYKTAILRGQGISFEPYGVAAIKALVLGKFILLGHAAGLGDRYTKRTTVYVIGYKSLAFMAMLLILSVVEEIVAGIIHGRTIAETLASFMGGTLLQVIASSVIMVLVLIPYFVFEEFRASLGNERMRQLLLEPRPGRRTGDQSRREQD